MKPAAHKVVSLKLEFHLSKNIYDPGVIFQRFTGCQTIKKFQQTVIKSTSLKCLSEK